MIELTEVNHHIQKYILSVLQHQKYVRFRDMRPPRVDTNLYSYHLKLLLRSGLVQKQEGGYTLGPSGIAYIDRVTSQDVSLRLQPKIVTMLLIQDGYGKVLLQKRDKQPYIDSWNLPYGKIHLDDHSVIEAGQREAQEKLGFMPESVRHVGDCYIRAVSAEQLLTSMLAHVMRFETDDISESAQLKWVEPLAMAKLPLGPAVEQIVTRAFFGDEFFFEEFTIKLG